MPPDLPDRLDPELLARYLAGECAEAETAVVRRYLMAHPEEARALARFVRRLDGEDVRGAAPEAAASWQTMRERLRASAAAPGSQVVRHAAPPAVVPVRSGVWRRLAGLAASAGAAAALGIGYGRTHRAPAVAAGPRTYATVAGERAELRLVDGTRVRIGPRSRLRVASDYGAERRDVYLEGEAYFDVRHDVRRPFTVFAGNASARDLGTAFAVRSYAEDGAVQVVVRSGTVALSGVGTLGAGDVGRLSADGRSSLRHAGDVAPMLGWLDGRLAFDDARLDRVLVDLRRWYDLDVRLDDSSLAALPFTGTIAEASPDDAVALVAVTLGLRARREGAAIVLERVPGRTPRTPRAPRASWASRRATP
ncbi:MAG: FecR domain-containing protein [Gemmatirosa sp.]|nr:FecR domain-containing protein [Gemmatirosa sp.]